jgi:membrane-associated protein
MIELLKNLCDPSWIMEHGGLYIVLLIVFAETGLFVGFFLPGDSLLFIAGVILANSGITDNIYIDLSYWVLLIAVAGIAGNFVGYWFGRKSGALLMERKDSRLFKKKHLLKAREFYEQRGGTAIIIARFLPIVRTFAPIIAGMVQMDLRKFSFYNIAGSFLWVGSIVTGGFFLGNITWVKENLELIILGIVAITTLPVVIKLLSRKSEKLTATEN